MLSEHLLYKPWLLGWHKYLQYLTAHKWASYTYCQNYSFTRNNILTASRFTHRYDHILRTILCTQSTHWVTYPILSLSLNTLPQAQLEVPRAPPNLCSSFSWLHASLTLLDPSDSARLDPFGQLVCLCGPSQLSCCSSVGASFGALFSAWPSVDL